MSENLQPSLNFYLAIFLNLPPPLKCATPLC